MFGYHVPSRTFTVPNEKNHSTRVKDSTINGIDKTSNDFIIIFDDFETAVAFAKDIISKYEDRELLPIYEFYVNDQSKIERVEIDETGKVVDQGGKIKAWLTPFNNLVKVRATLGYTEKGKDIPDFVFSTGKKVLFNLIKNQSLFSGLGKIFFSFLKNWSKHKVRHETSNVEALASTLSKKVMDLQNKLGADNPKSFLESSLNIPYIRALLVPKKRTTIAELVPANDGTRKEQEITNENLGYNKLKKK